MGCFFVHSNINSLTIDNTIVSHDSVLKLKMKLTIKLIYAKNVGHTKIEFKFSIIKNIRKGEIIWLICFC
jgi:hypothetical protein